MNGKTILAKVDKICGENTIRVSIQESVIHPKYKKKYSRTHTYKVHVDKSIPNIGDVIEIKECRPMSKTKSWIMSNSSDVTKETV